MPTGWSAAEWAAYKSSMPLPAKWASHLSILDLDHHELLTVADAAFLEGQWDLVGDGDVDRTFRGTFFDIGGSLAPHLDPSVAPRRLLQVAQGTYVEQLGRWLWVPTFTGRPHVVVDNGGGAFNLEAQGKDCFHNRGVPAGTFDKGSYVVDAIRDYLIGTGETYLSIPSSTVIKTKLSGDVHYGGAPDQMTPLAAMRKIASYAGCQLYWDGAGVATLRPFPLSSSPLFTWDEPLLLSEPTYSTDMSTLKNRYTGGGKNTLRVDKSATGVFSPDSLARKGRRWSDIDFGDDDEAISSSTALEAFALRRVIELVTLSTQVACSVVPFHACDPLDIGEVHTPGRVEKFTIRDASVPIAGAWTAGSEGPAMSLGSHHSTRRGGAGSGRITGTASKPRRRTTKKRR